MPRMGIDTGFGLGIALDCQIVSGIVLHAVLVLSVRPGSS